MKESSPFYSAYATVYGFVYRSIMRFAHRFNWHYAPPSYPDGDTMLWCQWCGMRDVVKRKEGEWTKGGPSLKKAHHAD